MKKLLALPILAGAFVALTPNQASATPGTCTITAQPWDGRSYALAAVVDGHVQNLITKQHDMLEGQTSWTFTTPSGAVGDPIGVTEVWWAARNPANQDSADDFYDVLNVNPDCRFATPYKADPGHQDSVIIRTATYPAPTLPIETTTTQPAPTTTSTLPEATTTTTEPQPEPTTSTRPAPTTTYSTTPIPPTSAAAGVTTTIAEPTVDVPLTPAPTTTAPTPEVPSSSVELFTATSVEQQAGTLPHTGIELDEMLKVGLGLLGFGLIGWVLSKRHGGGL